MGGIRPFDTLSEHFDTNEVTSASHFVLGASLSLNVLPEVDT